MKGIDLYKEQCERKLSPKDFLKFYNENLPQAFPLASLPLLRKFRKACPSLFKEGDIWTLDQHRRKFMDWIRQYNRTILRMQTLAAQAASKN